MVISRLLKRIKTRKPTVAPTDTAVDALRIEFKDRYHSFKLLLSANHKALEIMAAIEEALNASRPFGMTFVRGACTSVAVNVFSMVRNIAKLAPGKYDELFSRFDAIQKSIDAVLTRRRPVADELIVIDMCSL